MTTLSDILALDAKRTQGEWDYADAGRKFITTLYARGHSTARGRTKNREFGYTANTDHEQQVCDAEFIAAAPDMVALLKSMQKKLEQKDKALLLAARWFKLYQEDKTRYEHPASDADLLGMFDAMKAARTLSDDQDNGEKGSV